MSTYLIPDIVQFDDLYNNVKENGDNKWISFVQERGGKYVIFKVSVLDGKPNKHDIGWSLHRVYESRVIPESFMVKLASLSLFVSVSFSDNKPS